MPASVSSVALFQAACRAIAGMMDALRSKNQAAMRPSRNAKTFMPPSSAWMAAKMSALKLSQSRTTSTTSRMRHGATTNGPRAFAWVAMPTPHVCDCWFSLGRLAVGPLRLSTGSRIAASPV